MSLNAWPSHKMELYDGWIIRFSYFYTHRTNSVEQFGVPTLPWREKIPYCEALYRRLDSPVIFKISPLVSPDFDYMLENRGYVIEHETEVMTRSLEEYRQNILRTDIPADAPGVEYANDIPSEWIEALFNLKGTTNPVHRTVVPSMYKAILKETICAHIRVDGQIAATGLGILDRDYIGIYAIHVREDLRRRGFARMICAGLLRKGIEKGARNAYLQVVAKNTAAQNLYESLGFSGLYSYWFRVKR